MRIIVGITGASGAILGYELLKVLKEYDFVETYLVMSEGGMKTLQMETPYGYEEICQLADHVYKDQDLGARISSGSFVTDGMVIIPCSMKSVSALANGFDANLVCRAADVCRKEDRKVIIVPREMPLNLIHLRNLMHCSEAGYQIIPPVLTFYNHPHTIQDQIDHIIGKILLQFGIQTKQFQPWKGSNEER